MAIIDELLKRAQENQQNNATQQNPFSNGEKVHETKAWRDWKGAVNVSDLETGKTRRQYYGPASEKRASKDSFGADVGQAAASAIQRQEANYKSAGATLLLGAADLLNGKKEYQPKVGSWLWRLQEGSEADTGAANKFMEDAKAGRGKVGQLVMDLTSGAVDLASDALLTAATGGATIGGKLAITAGLGAMGARSFGGGAEEAREQGKSIGQQFLTGAKSAAIEMLTEKIGGPFEKAYGTNALSKFNKGLASRLSNSAGMQFVIERLIGAGDEASEEMLSDVLNPLADKLLKLDNGEGWESLWTAEGLGQMAYDGLVGGLLGLAGGVAEGLSPSQREALIDRSIDNAMEANRNGRSIANEMEQDTDGRVASAIANSSSQETDSEPSSATASQEAAEAKSDAPQQTTPEKAQPAVKREAGEFNAEPTPDVTTPAEFTALDEAIDRGEMEEPTPSEDAFVEEPEVETETEPEAKPKGRRIGKKSARQIARDAWFRDNVRQDAEPEGVAVDASDFNGEASTGPEESGTTEPEAKAKSAAEILVSQAKARENTQQENQNKKEPDIKSFRGKHAFLSNMFEAPVMGYKSAEAAFQASKASNEADRAKFKNLSGKEARALGRKIKLRSDWNNVRVDVMRDIIRAKFRENPELAKQLLATGNANLVEGNTWGDTFWGEVNGLGQNQLGKILMEVREELRQADTSGADAEAKPQETSEPRKSNVRAERVIEQGKTLDLDQVPDRAPDYSRDEAEFQAAQEKADRERVDAERKAKEERNEERRELDEDVKKLIEEDRRQPNLTGFKEEQNKIEKIERELGGKQAENADEYNAMMAEEVGGKARDVKQEKFDKLREEDKKMPTSAEAERDARKKERVDKVVSEEEAKVNFETASRFWGARHRAVMDAAKNVSDLETFIDKGNYAEVGNRRDQAAAKTLSDFRSQMNGVANGSDDIADLFYTYETFKNSTVLSEFYDADVQRMIDAYNRHADERSSSYNPDVLAEESARIMSLMAYRMKQANEWHDIGVELNSTIGSRMSKAARKLAKSKNLTSSLARAFVRWQINPDTVFKMIDGFSGNKNSAGYKLAQELKDGVKKHYEVLLNARSNFNDLVNQDGYLDFAFGKEKITDSEGREWDARTAVDLIRGVQTLLSTSDEKIDGIKGFALKHDDGSYEYIDFGEPSGPEGAMNYDNAGDEAIKLAKELSGKLSKVAKNYNKAASKAFESVTEDLKRVYRENVGEDIGMMGDFKKDAVYHPVWWKSPDSDDTVKWTIKDSLEGRWMPRFLHSRSEAGGAYLVVRPVTDTIQNYFDQASNYIAYSAFANKMNFLNRDSEHKASLSRSLAENYGKDMGNWMTNYVDDISSFFNEEDTDGVNALLRQSRRAIQQGALLFSVSVPMKQISSYWAASSVLHMDSLAHAYRLKVLKPLNSPGADTILASRRLGNYDQSAYEAQQDAKKGFGKLKYKYPFINWASNTISMMDYNTVSNLLTATEYDVLKYQFNGDKSKVGTEAYNNAVKDLFQEVVLRSQPIFDKQMRAEYGRTDNELIRMSSMFRTQQTQNLNLIATAIGEYKAAKGEANEAKATERLKQTIEGQVASALSLSVLSILADFALHKFRKYRDEDEEDDPVTIGKTLERLGINAVASASSTLWFGDTLAKWTIDRLSGGKTNEFYGINLGVVTTLSNVIDAVSSVVQQPTRSNAKYAAGQIATMLGIPLNNAYSLINSAVMYAKDATGSNEGNYDDILRYLDAQTKAEKKAEEKAAKEAAKAAKAAEKSGADMLADTAKKSTSQSELNSAEEQKASEVGGYLTKPYNALVNAGMSSQRSKDFLGKIDADGNNSVKQAEMIAYYKAHPEDEQYVAAMWNSYGYKTSWEKAKKKAG